MNADLIEQYRQLHERKPDYGSDATHLERIAGLIECHGVTSVLDFGCGKGALVAKLQERFPEITVDSYDPAIAGKERVPLERYDMVIANDVLEHLDPADFWQDLRTILHLDARWLFFNISCRPAVNVLPNGTNCHTLVRKPVWWRMTLTARFPHLIEHDSQWDEREKAWMFMMAKPLDLTGKRVAIVGNAPPALKNTEDIDGFDCVIRFNNFAVGPGFEAVGTRTDALALAGCNGAVIAPRLQRFTMKVPYVLDLATIPNLAQRHRPKLRQLVPHATLIDASGLTGDLCHALCAGIPGATPIGKDRLVPSTGISAIAWALRSGASEIYLTGFSFEVSAGGHYFAAGDQMSACHDFLRELRWLAERSDHPGLRFDAHIEKRVELWLYESARGGSADAYQNLSDQ